jgi:hypothetical protein
VITLVWYMYVLCWSVVEVNGITCSNNYVITNVTDVAAMNTCDTIIGLVSYAPIERPTYQQHIRRNNNKIDVLVVVDDLLINRNVTVDGGMSTCSWPSLIRIFGALRVTKTSQLNDVSCFSNVVMIRDGIFIFVSSLQSSSTISIYYHYTLPNG